MATAKTVIKKKEPIKLKVKDKITLKKKEPIIIKEKSLSKKYC